MEIGANIIVQASSYTYNSGGTFACNNGGTVLLLNGTSIKSINTTCLHSAKWKNEEMIKCSSGMWTCLLFIIYGIFFTFETSERYPNYGTKYENFFCKFLILLF